MSEQDAMDERIRHLHTVEKLSLRQIARQLGVCRKRVRRVTGGGTAAAAALVRKTQLDGYCSLIEEWYRQYPRLQAKQIHERLRAYGYAGGYGCVKRATRKWRVRRPETYHPLVFHPGQEAQVDWFFYRHPVLGMVAGFLYVLAYSRYGWGIFYPRTTFEFFLAGHLECYRHLGGVPRGQRYDNTRSVVLGRDDGQVRYNPKFLEFAAYYGVSVHVCNPYSGNEKGRVERVIRDVRAFLAGGTFLDMADLNRKFQAWLERRNNTVHRTTGKTPKALLADERLQGLPPNAYPARRLETAVASKTALVEFETNRYSVPTGYAGKMIEVAVYPERLEFWSKGQRIAAHPRCYERRQMVQNPLHAESLLERTPRFRMERVRQLIAGMDPATAAFLDQQEDEAGRQAAAYQIFQLIRTHSRGMVLSAVRELAGMKNFRIQSLMSLLRVPGVQEAPAVWPKDPRLLTLTYEQRRLSDYDPGT